MGHVTTGGESVHLTALGRPFVVEIAGSGAARLAARVRAAWSRCLDEGPGAARATSIPVYVDDDPALVAEARAAGSLAGSDDRDLMDALSPRVTTAAIVAGAGTLLMFHAGAVADPRTGRAVALVGASGAGKTTAVRRLATDLGYVTDETVAIDGDDQVVAYPKPLSVLEPLQATKSQLSPDDLGLHGLDARCHLASMVVLARDPARRGAPSLEPVATLDALAALAPETSSLARLSRPLHRLAGLLDGVGGLQRLHYRDADDLAPLVTELVGAR
ncbi:MAG: hypothetical protein JWR90_1246 [Marmoricola sp.]|jgi:hypothetical protein|nr:hypothetical protein [Marmoricola sp.]